MKAKLYIVTYDSPFHINKTLDSLFLSNLPTDLEINIINNHTNFALFDHNWDKLNEFGKYKIHHNTLQANESTGYLQRNWNQAITSGFKSLNNPDCDLVVCCQDDTGFHTDWFRNLVDLHRSGLHFIATGIGDNFCSHTPHGIKTIGLWDERFGAMHWYEHDYFLRVSSWLGNGAAIQDGDKRNGSDRGHGQLYYIQPERVENITYTVEKESSKSSHKQAGISFEPFSRKLFIAKWGYEPEDERTWCQNNMGNKLVPQIQTPILYPWFEKDIDDLQEKGYLI